MSAKVKSKKEEEVDSKKVVVFTKEAKGYERDRDLLGDSPGGAPTVGALRASISDFMPSLGAIVSDVKSAAADAGLQEVTVALGINAKGSVGFLGTGSEIGGTATLTLKFKT